MWPPARWFRWISVPVLLASASDLPRHVKPDPAAGPLHFRLADVVEPSVSDGLPLIPFFRLHDARYQMYWQLTTKEELAAQQERLAAEERAKALREANTLDRVAVGRTAAGSGARLSRAKTPIPACAMAGVGGGVSGSNTRSARAVRSAVELAVTYWGGEASRAFDILANGELLATETFDNPKPGQFFEKRYPIPARVLSGATDGRVTIKFSAKTGSRVGGVYDVRLMKPDSP